jgi:hypothetical protein
VEDDLLDIRTGIKAGRYVNEATVSQGIVQRLLNALGWPVYNTEVVAPEYSGSASVWRPAPCSSSAMTTATRADRSATSRGLRPTPCATWHRTP